MRERIRFDSYSMWTKRKYEYDIHEWCVFVNEPSAMLDQIDWVEYTLHPTFPDPVRKISDRHTRFALMSSAWGNFDISILVHFIDGAEVRTSYYLELKADNWPRKFAEVRELGETNARVYADLPDGSKYRWRKVSTIAKSIGMTEERVAKALSQLAEDNLVRRAPFKSIGDDDLWGSTMTVGIAPRIM